METIEHLKYPIGKFEAPKEFSETDIKRSILYLVEFPAILNGTVEKLTEGQLCTPYREGGWTVKQLLHHIPDSHMNAYIRFKLALTENNPTIKPYNEAAWANLYDSKITGVSVSLTLLGAVHERWTNLLQGMTNEDFNKTYFHPEHNKTLFLWSVLAMYEWHSKHHLAHITTLVNRNNW